MEATIKSLCDKHLGAMSRKVLAIAWPGDTHFVQAYVCDVQSCNRCYNEGAGYFDFIAGEAIPGDSNCFAKTTLMRCSWNRSVFQAADRGGVLIVGELQRDPEMAMSNNGTARFGFVLGALNPLKSFRGVCDSLF